MLIAWTTVGSKAEAERLAEAAVESRLAACVQIDGPIASCYRWEGRVEHAQEYRLCFKFLPERSVELTEWIHRQHPYAVPEWIVTPASQVGEKYLSWVRANSSNPPL